MRTILLLAMTIPFLAACGYTERRQIVNGRDADQVWAAMKAVAQTPDYYTHSDDIGDRWIVRENDVAFDDDVRRMEVYRKLERELHKPLAPVTREEREWKFEIALEEPPVVAVPTMRFRTRNAGVPAHAWDEASWFFNEVEAFLGPAAPPQTAPAIPASSESTPASPN